MSALAFLLIAQLSGSTAPDSGCLQFDDYGTLKQVPCATNAPSIVVSSRWTMKPFDSDFEALLAFFNTLPLKTQRTAKIATLNNYNVVSIVRYFLLYESSEPKATQP